VPKLSIELQYDKKQPPIATIKLAGCKSCGTLSS
jgi:hypothetical protein